MSDTLERIGRKKSLVNVLGVVYVHKKTTDGGDIYLTRFAEPHEEHLEISNWYETGWFESRKIKLLGTSAVYRVPTKPLDGRSLDLVVKNCRVGEDVPLNTHTLQEFCDAEFNSPWEEFSLTMELREGDYGPRQMKLKTQRPLAIYVPPERMQLWQSGRSQSKISRIRARHPGIDLDILKQYKLVYEWIRGKNLIEVFEGIEVEMPEIVETLKAMQRKVTADLGSKGYLMADMKPEHVIIGEDDCRSIEQSAHEGPEAQVRLLNSLVEDGAYSIIDYELLFRTPGHEDAVKSSRRHSYLDDQKNRFKPTPMPSHLSSAEIFGVPYVYGHAESTGGHLWVVGRNARLFDYFLPERWRKTPSLSLSDTNEVYYTVTKDNIHLVWKTSRVGEFPPDISGAVEIARLAHYGINSPFEEFSMAFELNRLGIHCAYVRAVYMTGSAKVERSNDLRKYAAHRHILASDGSPVLQEGHNYITIQGYYNGPDEWVPEHENALYTPMDLLRAVRKGVIVNAACSALHQKTIERLREAGYDGTLLKPNDLLIAIGRDGRVITDSSGEPDVIICNLSVIWKAEG